MGVLEIQQPCHQAHRQGRAATASGFRRQRGVGVGQGGLQRNPQAQ